MFTKIGRMICGGFCEKSVSYNTYSSDSSSWIINGLVSSCSTNVDISDDESGMARGILFKPRVEATKQMTQNWTFRGPRISESANIASKWHVCSSYFMFSFYFTPENLSRGNLYVESSSTAFLSITLRSSSENIWQKMSQVLLFAEFKLDIDRKILRYIFLVDFK